MTDCDDQNRQAQKIRTGEEFTGCDQLHQQAHQHLLSPAISCEVGFLHAMVSDMHTEFIQ